MRAILRSINLVVLTKRLRWHLTKIAQRNQSTDLHDSWRSSWKSCRLSRGDFSCYKVQNYKTHMYSDLVFFLHLCFFLEISHLRLWLGAWDLPECRKNSIRFSRFFSTCFKIKTWDESSRVWELRITGCLYFSGDHQNCWMLNENKRKGIAARRRVWFLISFGEMKISTF